MLELMKLLLNKQDCFQDTIFEHYLSKARSIICGYLGLEELDESLEGTIVDFAVFLYRNKDAEGIVSQTQGSRSVSYSPSIPESIKIALPKPKARVGGR